MLCLYATFLMLYRPTRNTRIERLWVETGTQFAHQWHAFFTCLAKRHGLNPSNYFDLWLLHRLIVVAVYVPVAHMLYLCPVSNIFYGYLLRRMSTVSPMVLVYSVSGIS
jgi:hypothetical protein